MNEKQELLFLARRRNEKKVVPVTMYALKINVSLT